MEGVRRRLATVLVIFSLVLVPPATALAADEATTTTSQVPTQDIIPEPNSGSEPEDAGDRGGALQTVLFVGIIGMIVAGGAIVVRQSRRARAERS